jgi:preprotein translocase subunit SecY
MTLASRIWFTLGALVIYRLGVYVPIPGIDPAVWAQIFRSPAGGILQQFNFLSGGAVRALGIFSLGIMPYVTAAIILQLMTFFCPALKRRRQEGERGRQIIDRYTLYATLFLVAMQAYGIAVGLEGVGNVVSGSGWLFRLSTVITLTGGTLLLVWLSQQITARGIGNGIALLLVAGIAAELPREIAELLVSNRLGVLTSGILLALLLVTVGAAVLVVTMERARRRLPIWFAERRAGTRMLPSQSADLALKLNPAGIIPAVLASWLTLIVVAAVSLAAWLAGKDGWIGDLTFGLGYGTPLHLLVSAAIILFFAFVYTAFVSNPDDMAEKLDQQGGALPGIASGSDRRASRSCDLAHHRDRHGLSRAPDIAAGYSDQLFGGNVPFPKRVAASPGLRHPRYRSAGPGRPAARAGVTMPEVDRVLRREFEGLFGPITGRVLEFG